MAIDSPDEAAGYYNKALKERKEPMVIRDLGKALVKTHDYKNAIDYYSDALKGFTDLNNNNIVNYYEIATDQIRIMLKLSENEPEKAHGLQTQLEKHIEKLTEDIKKNDDYRLRKMLSNFKVMLSKVIKMGYLEKKKGEAKEIYKNLEEALKLSKEVKSRLRETNNKQGETEEKAFMSEICFEIGKYYEVIETQLDFAEKAYIESFNNWDTNQKSLFALSNVYVKKGNLTEAHKYADLLLRINEDNEEAIQLLISILNSKKSNEFTITYLEGILEKQSLSFKLIELYIEIVRRVGKINKAKDIINKCDKKLKYTYSPGLNYCKGLLFRYSGEINVSSII
jgi:tetratricopeptide (TPR) repeat protein